MFLSTVAVPACSPRNAGAGKTVDAAGREKPPVDPPAFSDRRPHRHTPDQGGGANVRPQARLPHGLPFYRFPFYRFPGDSVAAARMALSRPERYILWRTG